MARVDSSLDVNSRRRSDDGRLLSSVRYMYDRVVSYPPDSRIKTSIDPSAIAPTFSRRDPQRKHPNSTKSSMECKVVGGCLYLICPIHKYCIMRKILNLVKQSRKGFGKF